MVPNVHYLSLHYRKLQLVSDWVTQVRYRRYCKLLYLYCVVLIVDDSDYTAGIRFAPASGRRQVPRVGYRRLSAEWRFPSLGRHGRAVPHTVLLAVACLLDRNKM